MLLLCDRRRRLLLVSVIVTLCGFLPLTRGSPASNEGDEEAVLMHLLEKLRNAFKQADDTRDTITTLEDNVNEEHSWGEDTLRMKASHSRGQKVRLTLPNSQISPSDQQALIDAMNAKRRLEGAANMYQLIWNAKLANLAQLWSDRCAFNHGSELFDMDDIGFSTVGQTLAASTDSFSPSKVVDTWYSLKRNYDARADTCLMGQACGAYKQLVSGYTTDVGCGLTTCPSIADSAGVTLKNAYYIVCYYGPPGSYGLEPTIIPGTACTKCKQGQFYCNDGLCNSRCQAEGPGCTCAAACQNCATLNRNCTCSCKPGSTGVDCGNACVDQPSQKCGQRGGWKKTHCNLFDFVKMTFCPKYCEYCIDGIPCA